VDATVIDLAEFERALRARDLLVRLLSPYASWFQGARLEVKATGRVVVLAITTSAADETRAGVFARVASHLGEVPLETRLGEAGTASPSWRARERPGEPARKDTEP
jgi:hypothetical protein